MKICNFRRILSLIVSVVLVFSMCFEIIMSVSAVNETPKAVFSYGDFNGVASAIGTNPDDIEITGDQITLPNNENAINLYWSNGKKSYKAGSTVSVSSLENDEDGNYPFVAMFGGFSLDYDEIDTNPFTFYTDGGTQVSNDGFFSHLNKNSWWHIPNGYANDGKNTAFGATSFAIKKRTDATGNNLYLKAWEGGEYKNALFFTHSPFDSNDVNSHNSNASGNVNYKYAYFTPGEEYTLSFDYKLDTNGGGSAPYVVSIAFGMDTQTGNDKCGKKTIEYVDGSVKRTNVDLGTESGVWKRTSVTIKAPESYTGNGITSARMGISCNIKTAGGCYIDNIDVQHAGTKVTFKYEEADGASSVFGKDLAAYADEDGNFTVPRDDSAINLLWKHGNMLYEPGTNLNINDFGDDLTFTAFFGGANLDYENICTDNVSLVNGTQSQNLFEALSRNADYWTVPAGLSNIEANKSGRYGMALGHDRMAIVPNAGKTGKGLRLRTNVSGPHNLYRSAALFAHSPTSFNSNSTITYSYVYYNTNTEYTIEFDYKTVSEISATIAFGVNTASEFDSSVQSVTVNSNTFANDGKYITLPATGDEWKHASITVKSPASYVGNGVTSGRVGIAIKDNEENGNSIRYNYFDNISFYPTTMTKDTVRIITGFENSEADSKIVSYFKAKDPLKVNSTIVLPEGNTIRAGVRKGVNSSNVAWSVGHGHLSNLVGWQLLGSDEVYSVSEKPLLQNLPENAVFSAVYGDASIDFNNLSNDFKFFNNGDTSYGYMSGKIEGDSNKYVNLTGGESQNNSRAQVLLFSAKDSFLAYNLEKTYKVTFKYRRTDTENVESKLFFTFGAIPWSWRAESGGVSRIEIGSAKKGMTEFETITVFVTAPNTYLYSTGGNNPEYFYSKSMAVGATLSNGVSVDIDDISISLFEPDKKDVNIATFDYGSSKDFNDTKTVEFTDVIYLPIKQIPRASRRAGTNSMGEDWYVDHGQISNHTSWYCTNNNTYYGLGAEVSVDEVGKNPKFIAMYEGGEVNFDNIDSNLQFFNNGNTSYGYMSGKIEGDKNKYANLTGGESQNNSRAQVLLFNDEDNFLGFNAEKTYKVTFKYRRTDTKGVDSNLFFAFGAIPWSWRAESGCVSRIEIGPTKKGMTEFETKTVYVTAPNTYLYNSGGEHPEYFYSRTMAIGATLSNGVSIDIDDISVEPIGRDKVTMTFVVPANNIQKVVIGRTGDRLTIPKVQIDRNNVIEGWYLDQNFEKAFNLKKFPNKSMTVYAKLGDAKVRYYGFKDYPWDASVDENGQYARTEKHVIEKGRSSDGDGYALKIVNTDSQANDEQLSIALPVSVKPNTKYVISYDFYYEEIGDTASSFSHLWFNTSVTAKAWQGVIQNITTIDEYTPANLKEKKWYTGYVYGTTSEFDWSNRLVLMVRVPVGSIRYIDNIVITEVSSNENVVLWKLGSFQSPKPTIAKKNSSIKLPKAKLEGNYVFLSWMLKNEEYTNNAYVVEEDTIFTAKITASKFSENFEDTYYGQKGITTFGMDLDWEIYDSRKNTKSNAKNGRYSLHRIGKDIRNKAYCFHHNSFVTEYTMAEGQVYTVSFWAKVENPVHTLGSIDIASCISLGSPWDFASEKFNVSSIADIADGNWHKVSYTFMASGPYLSLVVPGNLSIYIDGLTVEYTPKAELSQNCVFEEYIPAPLTSDGKYVKPLDEDDGLGKFELVKRTVEATNGMNSNTIILFVVIGVVAIALAASAITILIIRKKKVRR